MAKRLFVGGLPYSIDDAELTDMFSKFGTVVSANIITDRETRRSKGFGFVEMSSDEEADAAIAKLDGAELEGRKIAVNEAKPREERPNNGFGGGNFRRENNRRGGNRY